MMMLSDVSRTQKLGAKNSAMELVDRSVPQNRHDGGQTECRGFGVFLGLQRS
jgi:hypothetical protein